MCCRLGIRDQEKEVIQVVYKPDPRKRMYKELVLIIFVKHQGAEARPKGRTLKT